MRDPDSHKSLKSQQKESMHLTLKMKMKMKTMACQDNGQRQATENPPCNAEGCEDRVNTSQRDKGGTLPGVQKVMGCPGFSKTSSIVPTLNCRIKGTAQTQSVVTKKEPPNFAEGYGDNTDTH